MLNFCKHELDEPVIFVYLSISVRDIKGAVLLTTLTDLLKGVPKKTKLAKNARWILNMKDLSQEAVLFTVWCTHEYIKL